MKYFKIKFGNKNSDLIIGNSYILDTIGDIVEIATDAIIIADTNVNRIYENEIFKAISNVIPTHVFTIKAVEKNKVLSLVESLLNRILLIHPKKTCVIISFGGGLTGNISGMVAALLYRGVKLIHIPTTLLAMSDSIISQKQAVNSTFSKNSFGLFHLATRSYIDTKYLKTLDTEQVNSGLIEIVKNCLAFDEGSIDILRKLLDNPYTDRNLEKLILLGIKQKQMLIDSDPYEQNMGIVLEYGHTIGHGLELSYENIHHGQAVGLGMLVASFIAMKVGFLTIDDIRLHVKLLHQCSCPLKIQEDVDIEKIMNLISLDNKRGKISHSTNEIPMIILKKIGEVKHKNNNYLIPIDHKLVSTSIQALFTNYFNSLI